MQLPGSNALDLDKAVREKIAAIAKHFPHGVAYRIIYDTTMFISASMHDVLITLAEALALVIAVVFLFLQSWRTTVIPGIAIPVSLIATLAAMLALGFSLNTVSMLGMVLAIGLVVDDAIVVVENVERQLENGLAPMAAAKAAMREVTGPIVATTAVLMAVFVPVAFLPGVTGRLYNQFALTIALSVAISAFNSLSLSPALSAVLLRRREPPRFTPFRLFNAAFQRTANIYANVVRHLIGARWIVLMFFAGAILVAYGLYQRLPTGFLPVEDQGYFFAVIQLPDGASLERTEAVAQKVRKILAAEDGVQDVIPVTGFNFLTAANQSNTAAEFAVLKPWHERSRTASEIVATVRPKLLAMPEAIGLSFDPPSIPGIATTGGFEFQVEDLTGHGAQALNDATQALLAEARTQPELDPRALFSTFGTSTPQYDFDLDRTKAKLLGLNLPDVFNTLLQILEDGRLTDAQGRTVDFRNAIVIMTSNIGASEIAKNTSIGFTVADETGMSYGDMKNRIMSDLKKVFRPEFLNRIDEVIVFHKLAKDEVKEIVDLMINRVRVQVAEHELQLELSDESKDLLVEKGWDPSMGARPLRRAIQRYIEDPLADFVLREQLIPGATVVIDPDKDEEGEVRLSIVKPKKQKTPVGVGAEGGSPEELTEGEGPSPEDAPAEPDAE